jgi:hypothetical protein
VKGAGPTPPASRMRGEHWAQEALPRRIRMTPIMRPYVVRERTAQGRRPTGSAAHWGPFGSVYFFVFWSALFFSSGTACFFTSGAAC